MAFVVTKFVNSNPFLAGFFFFCFRTDNCEDPYVSVASALMYAKFRKKKTMRNCHYRFVAAALFSWYFQAAFARERNTVYGNLNY